MTRTTARMVAIMAFIAALLVLGTLISVFLSYGLALLSLFAFALTLGIFGMLSSAARSLPGAWFLKAGFITGVASLPLTFMAPLLLGPTELGSWIAQFLWPIGLVLFAVGLLKSRVVPPPVAWLAAAWGVLVALRDGIQAWVPLNASWAETATIAVPAAAGVLFLTALAMGMLGRSQKPQ